jgi:hypothetical protein
MKKIFLILMLYSIAACGQPIASSNPTPIVFVHGFLASGDTWSTQIQRFTSNGYSEDQLFVFDWNTIGGQAKKDSLLDVFINEVLQKTHAQKINLVGHSAGGGLCYGYLKDSTRAAKVAHYAHIGSSRISKPAGFNGNVPTMNVYSEDDKVLAGVSVEGAVNIKETGKDHLQVAAAPETFAALYEFFNEGKKPATTSILPARSATIVMAGRAVTLGENKPLSNDTLYVYEYNPSLGKRLNPSKPRMLVTNAQGYWPAFEVAKQSFLEFELHPKDGRIISYYIEPSLRNNYHVYLRGLPNSGMAAQLLQSIPSRTDQATVAVFSANQAIVSGRDSVMIDDISLSTPSLAAASKTIIASFLFDDGDGKSSGQPIKSIGLGVFLNAVDISIPADPNKTCRIYYNGRTIALPCRAGKEAVQVAIFN